MATRNSQWRTHSRQQDLEAVRQNPEVSVLILGAGVNGIGTFRDLALQGVDVLMVDKGDFCSGASAASSHMIHGGIRYLENGEFRLVREAVKERNRLLQNAPHYVHSLATTIPIFSWFSGLLNAPLTFLGWLRRPSERGALVIKIGLTLYDAYAGDEAIVPRHDFNSRKASLAQFPRLNPAVVATATYYDAAMPTPERICIDLITDGEAASPRVLALNYVRAVDAAGDTVALRDEVSGEMLSVRPKVVINAAGPWIDFANQALGQNTGLIGGTKGSHLVLDHPELRSAMHEHEFFFENDDGRIVLIYPLLDKVLVGTTDIPLADPDEARTTPEEINYFLDMIRRVFPTIEVNRSHIVFHFAGVRPLPASNAANAGQISRDHSIQVIEPGQGIRFPVYCLVGGKWTTFRAFAEEAADKTLAYLGVTRRRSTANLAIGGGQDYPHDKDEQWRWLQTLARRTGLPYSRLRLLFERYGTRLDEMADYLAAGDDEPLQHQPEYSRREVAYLARQEKVVHLDDLILRRTLLGMLGQVTAGLVVELAEVVGGALRWPPERQQAEIRRTIDLMATRHGVVLESV